MSKYTLSSLLLLPPPPYPVSPSTLKAAYHPSITATLNDLVSLRLPRTAVLEIVVPCPNLCGRLQEPRSHLFQETEHLLARLYSLICIVCAQNSIEPDGPGGIDARVILLAYDALQPFSNTDELPTVRTKVAGPIVDLPTFALTRRQWYRVYSVESEHGGELFNKYISIVNRTSPPIRGEFHTVKGGISMLSRSPPPSQFLESLAVVHTTVAVGGTFDHLHAGHKLLLTATALLLQPSSSTESAPRRLIVGITGDELLKNKKYAEYLGSWKQRQESVVDFLMTLLYFSRPEVESDVETLSFDKPVVNGRAIHTCIKQAAITIECVEIQDPFGPTITDESVSALVVSGETRSGGALVNQKRQEKGWKTLEVYEVDVLDAQEDEQPSSTNDAFAAKISSTAIRKRKAESPRGPLL